MPSSARTSRFTVEIMSEEKAECFRCGGDGYVERIDSHPPDQRYCECDECHGKGWVWTETRTVKGKT